jgi:hypothetical protein
VCGCRECMAVVKRYCRRLGEQVSQVFTQVRLLPFVPSSKCMMCGWGVCAVYAGCVLCVKRCLGEQVLQVLVVRPTRMCLLPFAPSSKCMMCGWGVGSSIPEEASSSIPEASSKIPEASSNIPEASSSIPEAISSIPEASSSIPEASSSIPEAQMAVEKLKRVRARVKVRVRPRS